MSTKAQRRKARLHFADAVEAGRAAYPAFRVTIGTYYRRGRRALWSDPKTAVAEGADRACVMGFAMLGDRGTMSMPDLLDVKMHCPVKDCHFSGVTVVHLNDDHRWKPERIVAWLRSLP